MPPVFAPRMLIASIQDPEREVCLQRFHYIAGDPADERGRMELEFSVPLAVGDVIRLPSAPGSDETVRRRVREIEFRLADLRGLGEIYVPCLVFDVAD